MMTVNLKVSLLLMVAWMPGQLEAKIRGSATGNTTSSSTARTLAQVMGYGAEPDPSRFPLGLCEGDCDNDAECAGDMVCYQRDKNEAAPGCQGGDTFNADTDFCAPGVISGAVGEETVPPTFSPTVEPTFSDTLAAVPVPTEPPTTAAMSGLTPLEFVGDDNFGLPLGLCQGDCDADEDCLDDFVCFQREMFENVPGCAGRGEASIDYCTRDFSGVVVIVITPAPVPAPVMTETPQGADSGLPPLTIVGDDSGLPLGLCEGDCDIDADCLDNLVCFQRDMLDPVPGCSGQGRISYDYCIMGPPTVAPPETAAPVSPPTVALPATAAPVAEVLDSITMAPAPPVIDVQDPLQPQLNLVATVVEPSLPLGLCEGDCDTDTDCLDDLICFQRPGTEPVPGCSGTGQTDVDYCTFDFITDSNGAVSPVVSMAPQPAFTSAPMDGTTLPQLETAGDGLADPLGLCEGDCDSDADCLNNMVCFQRDLLDPVPGCSGQGRISYDYCILGPPTAAPVGGSAELQDPLQPQLILVATDVEPILPLGLCEGDCDTDLDCLDNLVCFQRPGTEPVPGCSGTGETDVDYCTFAFVTDSNGAVSPVVSMAPQPAVTRPPYLDGTPLPQLETAGDGLPNPLGLCQGDCDSDADCLDELVCFQRDLTDPVPGCTGEGRISYDYCIISPDSTLAPNTPLTLVPVVSPSVAPPDMPTVAALQLETVGDATGLPLGICQGDCDTDGDCLDELVCFHRTYLEPVPGCYGTGNASYDYCVMGNGVTLSPTWAPNMYPEAVSEIGILELESVSDGPELPLGLCQGDCDTDVDCLDELVCFQRDFLEPVPGCSGTGRRSYDYCVVDPFGDTPAPTVSILAPVAAPTEQAVNQPEMTMLVEVGDATGLPLGLCEGDCDIDADCLDTLICFQRNALEPVPGCGGTGRISYDYCIENPNPVAVTDDPMPAVTEEPVLIEVPVTAAPVAAPLTTPPVQEIIIVAAPVTAEPFPQPVLVVSSAEEAPVMLPALILVDSKDEKNKNGELLGACEGECDYNEDCAAGLFCIAPLSGAIPGCSGVTDSDKASYCSPGVAGRVRGRKKN